MKEIPSSLGRFAAIRDVLELRKSLTDAVDALSAFGPDSDDELVTLTPVHVADILERYLSDTFAASDVEQWSEALAGRDDVGLLEGFEELPKQAIFELSTPEINEPISHDLARRWSSACA